jgi:hypothetical protein
MKAPKRGTGPKEESIGIPALNIQTISIKIVGDSPLICNNWSAKAKKEMLDKQMKRAKGAKEAKNPEQNYEESLYRHPEGGFAFPAIAFKAAAVSACSHVGDITKVAARGAFHVVGQWVRIEGEPRMRQDMVRLGGLTADIRFRGEFPSWSASITIRYNKNVLSVEQISNLFNTAGFAIGVGEWRPEKDGDFGMFHVE